MAQEGETATVLRAGEYKALASSVEPLTEKAKAQIMDSLNHTYGIFLNHVAASRGTSAAVVKANMAEGKVFYGSDAASVGLTDGTTTFQALLSELTQAVSVDNGNKRKENAHINSHKRAEMPDALKDAAAELAEDVEQQEDTQDAVAEATASPAAQSVDNGNTLLAEMLQAAQAQVVDLKVQMKLQEAQLAEAATLKEQNKQLADIVQASVSQMRVALGSPAIEAADVATLLAEHGNTQVVFAKTFPVGGVAAITLDAETKVQASQDSTARARIRQTTLKTK
jgi:ClpP class serine protease